MVKKAAAMIEGYYYYTIQVVWQSWTSTATKSYHILQISQASLNPQKINN